MNKDDTQQKYPATHPLEKFSILNSLTNFFSKSPSETSSSQVKFRCICELTLYIFSHEPIEDN